MQKLSNYAGLNSGAVLWDVHPLGHWTTAEIYQRLGRPRKVPLTEAEGRPGELVEPIRFPQEMIRHPVYLGDFGLAILSGTSVENKPQSPLEFCAPERLHGMNPSFASEMWSFTCIFAKIYLGVEVVWGHAPTFVSRLVGTLGPLPEYWKGSYGGGITAKEWWYDQSGQILGLRSLEDMKHLNIKSTAFGLIFAKMSETMLCLLCIGVFVMHQSIESLLLSCWRILRLMLLCHTIDFRL
jgi:hypothetical protein